jgi:hypothetical protein
LVWEWWLDGLVEERMRLWLLRRALVLTSR